MLNKFGNCVIKTRCVGHQSKCEHVMVSVCVVSVTHLDLLNEHACWDESLCQQVSNLGSEALTVLY